MHVIGTAGHVDHGKSTLVEALTGINPDRLKEEQEREMTIDLGFAWVELPSGRWVGIVDVPGHKDFIKNMLAGVGGIDAALFVVAADEGVMPQTAEHLAILDLLQVRGGIVALTKVDLAEDEDWLELVTADLIETLESTCLEGAPIVRVSAPMGLGLDELKVALDRFLETTPERPDRGKPRLPIDRVFTIAGFGTVATGTLADGTLHVGQEVEIQPSGLKSRIRGLQTHRRKVETAVPGSRVALNLTGVSTDQLTRGDVVTNPGWLHPTMLVDVQLRYLPDAPKSLRHNTPVDFFSGAAEVPARVRLLGVNALPPGEAGWAQLQLTKPVPLMKGDRFIIRQPSPSRTLGGGTVVNPNPGRRHRRFRTEVTERLATMLHGTPEEILLQALEARQPCEVRELIAHSTLAPEAAAAAVRQLLSNDQAILLDGAIGETGLPHPATSRRLLYSAIGWRRLLGNVQRILGVFHREHPLRQGMDREEFKSRLGRTVRELSGRAFNAIVSRAVAEGQLVEWQTLVHLPDHTVTFGQQQQEQVADLLALFRRKPYTTPSTADCEAKVGTDLLAALIEQGHLVKVSDDVLFLTETYEEMVQRVTDHIRRQGDITIAQARDMFGASRKYALALMEYLDERRVTRRVGDVRVLRGG
ncbi:MAG: selenocysteine-specific translation elongation factor [Anaerolineae bacterium]|nr:MAG: selenocysteine-specific translation elongation factor [Anaerolineae bacterium]